MPAVLASIEGLRVKLQPGWKVLFERVLHLASCQATALHNQRFQHGQPPQIRWQQPSAMRTR